VVKLKILTLFLAFASRAYGQIEADSIFLYQDLQRAGTTASIQRHFRELDSMQVKKGKLTEQETMELKAIFREIKQRRFFQTKHGGAICYGIVWYEGRKYRYLFEGFETENRMRVVNMDTMKKWLLDAPEKVEKLRSLIQPHWSSN
jgi:hypothetical protein